MIGKSPEVPGPVIVAPEMNVPCVVARALESDSKAQHRMAAMSTTDATQLKHFMDQL